MTKLIYIGGYGHSGSTLLEYLIAGSPGVLACGEVASSLRARGGKRRRCTCGRMAADCPVWGFFFKSSDAVAWTHARLLSDLMRESSGHYAAVIDSSKTAWGSLGAPFRLRRRFGTEFVLVHLVRNPVAAGWSVIRQKNRKAKSREARHPHFALSCTWAAVSWWMANLACELSGQLYPRQYIRVRYEDLVRSPTETLHALFDKLLPGRSWEFAEGKGRDNRHQLRGNKIRFKLLRLDDVKEDRRWKAQIPPKYSQTISFWTYLLRLRYGYRAQ